MLLGYLKEVDVTACRVSTQPFYISNVIKQDESVRMIRYRLEGFGGRSTVLASRLGATRRWINEKHEAADKRSALFCCNRDCSANRA